MLAVRLYMVLWYYSEGSINVYQVLCFGSNVCIAS